MKKPAQGGVTRRSFQNYFWTVQLIAGLAMGARTGISGFRYYGFWIALLWALAGFAITVPLAALGAGLKVAYESRRLRRSQGQSVHPESM